MDSSREQSAASIAAADASDKVSHSVQITAESVENLDALDELSTHPSKAMQIGARAIKNLSQEPSSSSPLANVMTTEAHTTTRRLFNNSQVTVDEDAFYTALVNAGLSEEGSRNCIEQAGADTANTRKAFSLTEIRVMAELTKRDDEAFVRYVSNIHTKAHGATSEDDDLPTIKAKTMYKMVEDVEDSKAGIKKLLFLSSKQADLIARDPSAIDKMLAIFVDKQQPKMVINLLPSMIRCWTRVRPLAGDPDGEREGLAALDRFMAEHIIPLAEKTHAIILCSAVQPFCVLSESLSRMLKLVRSRWGSELPFTILSCTGQLPALYTVMRLDTTWREIRNLSKVWKKREKEGSFADAVRTKINKNYKNKSPMNDDFDMDLDPNGTNFIIVDPTSSSAKYDSYNGLITEIVRKLAAELPSIAIQTGKSKFSNLAETNASGIEVALSNMEAGTPVLLLDLTKRDLMPVQLSSKDRAEASDATAAVASTDGDAGPAARERTTAVAPEDGDAGLAARHQQIEWYQKQVENEERRRIKENLPDYDWDVCMIAHFHDGARRSLARRAHRTHCALATPHAPRTLLTHGGRRSAL